MWRNRRIVLYVFAALSFPALTVLAEVRYVRAGAAGTNSGVNWTDAYSSLQQALVSAVAGDELWVAVGTYRPSFPTGRSGTFQLRNNIAILGGFRGTPGDEGINSITTRPPDPDPSTPNPATDSILSGDLNANDGPEFTNHGDNTYHVVTGNGTNATAILDQFTISGGFANGASTDSQRGAGLFCVGGSPTINNCRFVANMAFADGGGAHARLGSSPGFSECHFVQNVATVRGGGLYAFSLSDPSLSACVFLNNRAGRGGGFYSVGTASTVAECTFSGNSAANNGGATYCLNGTVAFQACNFTGNSATAVNPDGFGGAAFDDNAATYYFDCDFTSNISADSSAGGAVHEYISSSVFDGCYFAFNQGGFGGAMSAYYSNRMVNDCHFELNFGTVGGGALDNFHGESSFNHCTFELNATQNQQGNGFGGGVHDYLTTSHFSNCTFRQNSADFDASGGGVFGFESHSTFAQCEFDSNFAGYGGGMYNTNCTTIVTDCQFHDNFVELYGGGCVNNMGSPKFIRCDFLGNSSIEGGALSNYNGTSASFLDCSFRNNIASNFAGGTLNSLSTSTYETCLFEANQVTATYPYGFGGGAFNYFNSGRIMGCVFRDNRAAGTSSGGGIYVSHGDHELIADCLFTINSSGWGGGIFDERSQHSQIAGCRFMGNNAFTGSGGGLNEFESTTVVVNSVFSGNRARQGGAIFFQVDSTTPVVNCTFSENVAALGAGVESDNSYPTLDNSILWGNTSQTYAGESSQLLVLNGGTLDVNHSCVQFWSGSFGGTGNWGFDPLLFNPKGPDLVSGTEDDDVRLTWRSSAIDAGRNASLPPDAFDLNGNSNVTEPVPFDLAGNMRVVDNPFRPDTGEGSAPIVDMGAFEFVRGSSSDLSAPFDVDDIAPTMVHAGRMPKPESRIKPNTIQTPLQPLSTGACDHQNAVRHLHSEVSPPMRTLKPAMGEQAVAP